VETNLQSPQSNAVSDVQGQWKVPGLTCARRETSYSSIWVGIDGYSDSTVEQTGTEQDCSRGRAKYYAWYEMYPKSMRTVRLSVSPGDTIAASVQFSSTNSYKLTLNDTTTGKNYSTTQRPNGAGRQSAEWVAEAPSSFFSVLPLANFGSVNFMKASATLNGHTGSIADSNWQNDPITMLYLPTIAKATPSALSSDGSSFSIAWDHN
jgi:Peptidase A4 family